VEQVDNLKSVRKSESMKAPQKAPKTQQTRRRSTFARLLCLLCFLWRLSGSDLPAGFNNLFQ
jgi:hypothetical protein